jgi:hypothetical protein
MPVHQCRSTAASPVAVDGRLSRHGPTESGGSLCREIRRHAFERTDSARILGRGYAIGRALASNAYAVSNLNVRQTTGVSERIPICTTVDPAALLQVREHLLARWQTAIDPERRQRLGEGGFAVRSRGQHVQDLPMSPADAEASERVIEAGLDQVIEVFEPVANWLVHGGHADYHIPIHIDVNRQVH